MTLRGLIIISLILGSIGATAKNVPNATDTIKKHNKLDEVVVVGLGAERNLKSTEMGRVSLSNKMIIDLPVMFGEPDIVKSLQTLPGVSQGTEGFTGLYVRGGDNDQNIFIYQGLPLYHVSHLGGIFSSFNVPTISRVDFYKAAFPANYGGRISSITDVTMKTSDYEKYHGQVSVGLLAANVFFTGPIIKNKTAFTVGLRRSWIDLISIPTLAIMNSIEKKKGKKHIGGYNFTDFNARLDHRFNSSASAYIMGYYGHDNLKLGLREFESTIYDTPTTRFFDEDVNKLSWGNWGILGAFDYHLGPGMLEATVYYSRYSSTYRQEREYQTNLDIPETYGYNNNRTKNSISDIGINANYFAELCKIYRLKVGVQYVHHDYLPEGILRKFMSDNKEYTDNNNSPRITGNEFSAFIDNNLNFYDFAAISAGLRLSTFNVQSHTFVDLEPRVSLKVALGKNYSIKASYARMSQYVQQISSNYINLPTDLWQPITPKFKPLRSDQYSIGFYGNLPWNMYFSVEGWYKDMKNLLEYREGVSLLNPDLAWDKKLTSGNGWSYGVDISVIKEIGKVTGSVGYGLLWNWRKFDELNQGKKFPAKFDNRHKININVNYKLTDRIDFNAAWTFMTGNRLTLAAYNYDDLTNQFPGAPGEEYKNNTFPGYENGVDLGMEYYPYRNNVRLPVFHHLDLGMSIKDKYKNGCSGIWNISIYNVYCRMNPITIKKGTNQIFEGQTIVGYEPKFKTLSFIPIIPSFSYTYIF